MWGPWFPKAGLYEVLLRAGTGGLPQGLGVGGRLPLDPRIGRWSWGPSLIAHLPAQAPQPPGSSRPWVLSVRWGEGSASS